MQKSRVIGRSHELENIDGGVGVRRQGVPQVGIEVGQAGAIDNEIEVLLQAARDLGVESEARLRNVAFDDFDLVAQKVEEPVAMTVEERIEYRRLFHHLFEAPLGRIRLLAADQKIDLLHVGQIQKRVRQPDFADEAGDTDQHDVLSCECPANGESRGLPVALKIDDGPRRCKRPALGWNHCRTQVFYGDIQLPRQSLRSPAPVGILFPYASERAARADDRLQQSARRRAIAKLQAVSYDALDAKMLG